MFIFKKKGNLIIWLVIAIVLAMVYASVAEVNINSKKITFSEFVDNVYKGSIKEAQIKGSTIEAKDGDGNIFITVAPFYYTKIVDQMIESGVKVEIVSTENSFKSFFGVILSWFPVLLLAGVWIYFMRNMQGGGKAMGFAKSKARIVSEENRVTFNDVAGIDEAKDELQEIVEFLKSPSKFQKLGGKIPRGCLLVGSPGTGKTLLAKAIAGEAEVPFFSISGSDFVEMFVGVGASRVRDMFKQAKEKSPCILFIDEIDAVGRHRGIGLGGGNDEREQTLNQLLVEMDGFSDNQGVIVIAATNRKDVLDPALLRPGRFDRQIIVPLPDIAGREQILKVHMNKVPLASDVEIKTIARGTPGFTGADLANLVNEAALLSARLNNATITMATLEDAKDKVMMGPERRSTIMSYEQRKMTAYHEGGHTLVALHVESDPLHKVTIMPRGNALGLTWRLPEDDRYSVSRKKLKSDLAVAMGGRVAEQMIFGDDQVTTGASGDIKSATSIAKHMVMQWGLSEKVGPILIGEDQSDVYLAGSSRNASDMSEKTAQLVDAEIKRLIDEGYAVASKILKDNIKDLHKIAEALLDRETLDASEIAELLNMPKKSTKSAKKDKTSD